MSIRISGTSSGPVSPGQYLFFTRIFPAIFMLVGLIALMIGIQGVANASASKKWPTTMGEIVESEVEREYGSGSSTGSGHRSSGVTYHARIFYTYKVNDVEYEGSRIAYGDYGSSNPNHAHRLVARYPEGKTVQVRYMPKRPNQSLLEPGVKGQAFILPLLGLLFLVAGGVMAVVLPRKLQIAT